jgi:hypothetical protein
MTIRRTLIAKNPHKTYNWCQKHASPHDLRGIYDTPTSAETCSHTGCEDEAVISVSMRLMPA